MTEEKYAQMMKSWMESAKTCAQLATAAMFLPTFITRDLIGVGKDKPLIGGVNGWFLLTWSAFILAIALAHTYQISATKLINTFGTVQPRLFPRFQFWLMVASLILGMACFVGGALELLTLPSSPVGRVSAA